MSHAAQRSAVQVLAGGPEFRLGCAACTSGLHSSRLAGPPGCSRRPHQHFCPAFHPAAQQRGWVWLALPPCYGSSRASVLFFSPPNSLPALRNEHDDVSLLVHQSRHSAITQSRCPVLDTWKAAVEKSNCRDNRATSNWVTSGAAPVSQSIISLPSLPMSYARSVTQRRALQQHCHSIQEEQNGGR